MRREPTGAIRLRGFIIRDAISITWSTGLTMLFQSRGDDKAHTKNGGHENAHKVCLRDVYRSCKRLKKTIRKKSTPTKSALEYYEKSVDHYMIHPIQKQMLEYLLVMLSVKGRRIYLQLT